MRAQRWRGGRGGAINLALGSAKVGKLSAFPEERERAAGCGNVRGVRAREESLLRWRLQLIKNPPLVGLLLALPRLLHVCVARWQRHRDPR